MRYLGYAGGIEGEDKGMRTMTLAETAAQSTGVVVASDRIHRIVLKPARDLFKSGTESLHAYLLR